ncbi:hypothetical protein [Streptomyces sp. PTD5-9]|uniref:hypothetical protein n=1 Tax=Streptomyces sp. PTD5-9 TaxID=3120150 RepID=UPI00300B8BCC
MSDEYLRRRGVRPARPRSPRCRDRGIGEVFAELGIADEGLTRELSADAERARRI